MDAAQILAEFAQFERLPVEAICAADADRAFAVPLFLDTIERYLAEGGDGATQHALFFIFHMLGQWREKAAYRPLARLLRRPPQELDDILGYASTEYAHRVMAAVFDGNPQPLYDVILDPEADEFVRSGMCEAIAMVTAHGELPREEAARCAPAILRSIRRANAGSGKVGRAPLRYLALRNSSLSSNRLSRAVSSAPIGVGSRISKRISKRGSTIPLGCSIARVATSLCSAIPSRSSQAGIGSARKKKTKKSRVPPGCRRL